MRRKIFFMKLRVVMLAALLILIPLANAGSQRVTRAGMDPEQLARIPIRLRTFVDQGTIAGAVTLVARNNVIVSLEAIGYQDLENKKPMQADTIFDIRSVTKPVTAIAIMILMEEGKLALDDPVEKYLPEFKTHARKEQTQPPPITIHHLLTHTSGLPLYRLPESGEIPIRRDRTLADYVSFLARQEPEFVPGTQFRYASGGFAILGRIIEVVSGKPYQQFMKQRIFDPLGMKDSFFFIPAEKQNRVATLYRRLDGKLSRWVELETFARNARYPGPEFGMYSTAADLASLGQMMLDGGTFKGRRILSRMSVAAMTANHTLNIKSAITQKPAYQGLGWGLTGDPMSDFPLTSTGSFGHNGAFGSIIWIDPKSRLIRIFLEHQFGSGSEVNTFMAMAGAAVAN